MLTNEPTHIIIHTSDVPTNKLWNQLWSINRYHKRQGFPRSRKGYYVGYHRLITGSKNYQCKQDNEVGAHCNTKLSGKSLNYQSLGICVGFDGDIEYMNPTHFKLLKEQVKAWQKYYKISDDYVKFHRDFNKWKTCPGSLIGKEFLANLLHEVKPSEKKLKKQEEMLKQLSVLEILLDKLKKMVDELSNR